MLWLMQFKIPIDLPIAFREKCKCEGVAQRQVIIDAIAKFLEE